MLDPEPEPELPLLLPLALELDGAEPVVWNSRSSLALPVSGSTTAIEGQYGNRNA